jgi:hypothetical protein
MLKTKLFSLVINNGIGLQCWNYNIRPKSSLPFSLSLCMSYAKEMEGENNIIKCEFF